MLNNMANLISVALVILIFYSIIRRAKQLNTDAKKTPGGKAAGSGRPKGYTNYRPHKDITSVSRDMGDKKSSVLKDDKNNDWLAQQLREEHRAFKMTSEMFDLKIEHASHCDARLLAQFHKQNCDANSIDLANGKSAHK